MGDRIHRWLALTAVAVVVAGFVGWRSLRSANSTRAGNPPAPVPSPQLSQLIPYSTPITDTLRIVAPATDSIALPRDPFAGRPLPRASVAQSGESSAPAPKPAADRWTVTTTLMAGSRRAALINDNLVYVGDPLPGGGTLTSVEHDHVVVTDTKGATHKVAVKEGNG